MPSRRPKGEGSLSQRADGRWAARVDLGRDAAGKRQRKTVYAATRPEAQAQLRALLTQQSRGALVASGRWLVADYLEHWLRTAVAPTLSPQTVLGYQTCIRVRLAPLLGTRTLSTLTRAHVQTAFAVLARRYQPGSVRQTRTVLHAALEHAVDTDLIPTNPATRLKLPRVERKTPSFFPPPEARRLLGAALSGDEPYGPLWALAITTGLRLGELLALRWEDVDEAAGLLQVQRSIGAVPGARPVRGTKTAAGMRAIPLIPIHRQALALHGRRWGAREGWLWPGPTGLPIRDTTARRMWYRFLRRHGLPRRVPHSTRHSTASLLVSLGVPVNVVAAILGHARATLTLEVYSHILPDATRAAMEQLEGLLGKREEE